MKTRAKSRGLSSFQIIILGFACAVLLGAALLTLPISSRSGAATPFGDTLFTSISAVCVTGLVVHDTATYWSSFGQAVILFLIQVGGLGVITAAASVALLSGRRISLMQRSTMQKAISAPDVGGIVRLTLFILKATLIFELTGAVFMMPVFCHDFGARGIWMAFFHSISAFCNAGFDILGTVAKPYQSLSGYIANPVINIVIMLLIIIGGIGFLTWEDIYTNKFHFRRYRMQSKVILVSTATLILIPAVIFFFCDFAGMPLGERILSSFFQSVTPRTAGFNTADLGAMRGGSRAIIIFLMLIGGSPGSTAGGMKTTTFAVLLINAFSIFKRREDAEVFGRRFENNAVRHAATVALMCFSLFFCGGIIISAAENLPIGTCLFEAASALGTVGLSLGITPALGGISRAVLIILMFLGRVGGLTFIFAAISSLTRKPERLPQERIAIG